MSVSLHVLLASGRLLPLEHDIRTAYATSIEKVSRKLNLPDIDVIVLDDPRGAIPETGVGGYAPSAHQLSISVDPLHPNLRGSIRSEIESTLAHELHHCARSSMIGYGSTLLDACVSEGLADHFDIEVNGGIPKPWSTAFTDLELEKILTRATADFNNKEYNHSAWFFGSEQEGIPRWAGYSIGFSLVQKHLEATGKTAAALVAEPSASFYP